MLPAWVASKLSPYDVCFGYAKVKVYVIHNHQIHSALAIQRLTHFKNLLSERCVVGLTLEGEFDNPRCLILCAGHLCLMIKLPRDSGDYIYKISKDKCLTDPFLRSLNQLLSDQTICFVDGNSLMKGATGKLESVMGIECKTWVKVGYLVATVRKNPAIMSYTLEMLGAEVGLNVTPRNYIKNFRWKAEVFSKEEIEFAIHDVYYSYLIGEKLLAGEL